MTFFYKKSSCLFCPLIFELSLPIVCVAVSPQLLLHLSPLITFNVVALKVLKESIGLRDIP